MNPRGVGEGHARGRGAHRGRWQTLHGLRSSLPKLWALFHENHQWRAWAFRYRDDKVVAFLTIEPVAYGHTLVSPVEEVDKWTDADPALWAHMNEVAQKVGNAIIEVFDAPRAGYLIAGFEVPHAHIHVFPASDMSGYSLANINRNPDEDKMDDAANVCARRWDHGPRVMTEPRRLRSCMRLPGAGGVFETTARRCRRNARGRRAHPRHRPREGVGRTSARSCARTGGPCSPRTTGTGRRGR